MSDDTKRLIALQLECKHCGEINNYKKLLTSFKLSNIISGQTIFIHKCNDGFNGVYELLGYKFMNEDNDKEI